MGLSRTLQLNCGGTITLTLDLDLFTLQGEERDRVCELIDAFAKCGAVKVGNGEPPEVAQPAPLLRRKSHKAITEEIKQKAIELIEAGATVSHAAIVLGVHRNSLHNAGIYFGNQEKAESIPQTPLTPHVCAECGGECSAGASRCKDCYDKRVAANKQAEERYRAGVAERKRQREAKQNLPVELPEPYVPISLEPSLEDLGRAEIERYVSSRSPEILKIAERLFQEHLAQCKKLGVHSDSSFAEFVSNAEEMAAWYKANPGKPYVERYMGKVISDDLNKQSYSQYR